MSSSETIAWLNYGEDLKKGNGDPIEIVDKTTKLFYGLFDNPDEARKVLKDVPIEGLADIYKKVMEQ